jgi:Trp operon repressor
MGQNFFKLLKTHIEKMSDNRLLAMLMKPNELESLSGDVYENKGSCSPG